MSISRVLGDPFSALTWLLIVPTVEVALMFDLGTAKFG